MQFPAAVFRPILESQTETLFKKLSVLIVHGVTLVRRAEPSTPGKKEHLRNVKTATKGSRIANYAWSNNHAIDFEMHLLLTKAAFEKENPNAGPITIPVPCLDSTTFFSTNILSN